MLPVENNFNKNGLPHVYIALFRCLWVPGGGLEPFRRVLRSGKPTAKNHPIINIVSGERGELARCPNLFVRDCVKKEFKECHTTCCNRVLERQGVYRLARTRNAHCKQRKQKKMDRNPPNKILEVTF